MLIELLYQKTRVYLLYSRLFSTALATLFSFLLAMSVFQPYILFLRRLGSNSELEAPTERKEPVMPAGIIFLAIIFLSCLIAVRPNSYVISALAVYFFFSAIGAVDDIAKVINKRRLAQGLITRQDYQYKSDGISAGLRLWLYLGISLAVAIAAYKYIPNISGTITVPFLSADKVFPHLPKWLFIPFIAMVIAVMANGVNFTDGFDTLAAVPMITCSTFIGLIAYVSSNRVWAQYLLIPYLPGVEELLPLVGSVIGVLLAFLWFNAPPSSIIMGDSGAVGLGGMIGIMFVFVKAEIYMLIVGFVFLMEFVSDILQIVSFRLLGKRIFLMAPIHHHFQMKMLRNPIYCGNKVFIKSKIAWRFHIISVVLLVVGLILFFKVR